MNKALILLILFIYSCKTEISKSVIITSPDDNIQVELKLDQGMPQYTIQVDGKKLIEPSALGYRFRNQPDLVGPFQLINSNTEMIKKIGIQSGDRKSRSIPLVKESSLN